MWTQTCSGYYSCQCEQQQLTPSVRWSVWGTGSRRSLRTLPGWCYRSPETDQKLSALHVYLLRQLTRFCRQWLSPSWDERCSWSEPESRTSPTCPPRWRRHRWTSHPAPTSLWPSGSCRETEKRGVYSQLWSSDSLQHLTIRHPPDSVAQHGGTSRFIHNTTEKVNEHRWRHLSRLILLYRGTCLLMTQCFYSLQFPPGFKSDERILVLTWSVQVRRHKVKKGFRVTLTSGNIKEYFTD